MEVDVQQRRVRLGAGELAEFRAGPRESGRGRVGRWRIEAGVAWHRELQEQVTRERAAAGQDAARYEVPIAATWVHRGWSIEIQGRIDQVLDAPDRATLREVKTVGRPLPEPAGRLREDYASYFAQASTYLVLASLAPGFAGLRVDVELVFVDIGSGVSQVVHIAPDDAQAIFEGQLSVLWDFLEARRGARERLDIADFRPPFGELRPGQELVDTALDRAAAQTPITAFEAPTGFGKTAYALHFALRRLKARAADRVVYLTGKSTGQIQVVRELERNWPGVLRHYQMRNKAEHAIRSPMHTCDAYGGCREGIEERWAQACIQPARLMANGPLDLQAVRALGERSGVCPYEISRAVLPFADLWIGDYNYIFHPQGSGVFRNQPGFDAARTLLLVDEAHNLPARVADAWSGEIVAARLDELMVELSFANAARGLQRAVENLHRHVERQRPALRLDLAEHYVLRDLLADLAEQLNATPLDPDIMRPGAIESLWELAGLLLPLDHEHLDLLLWVPQEGTLRVTCLDASWETGRQLREFGGVLLLSATLRPLPQFIESLGLEAREVAHVPAQAPWRADAYDVAVDCRVDTRFRTRLRHLGHTAETLLALRNAAAGPVAVLFPSYRYAEDVANVALTLEPGLRLAMQPRGVDLAGQRDFVEESLLAADVLLLVMGSGFTEGIDALGGRVSHAMVVSPGLPEADAVQAARMEQRSHLPGGRAFQEVYQIPGMRKVNQALGRLVRAPGQHTRVLLHCKRFAEASFQALLDDDFQPRTEIRDDEGLERWLLKG